MRKIKDIPAVSQHKSFWAAGKQLRIDGAKLIRWNDTHAWVDDNGQVWIKTGKPIKELAK